MVFRPRGCPEVRQLLVQPAGLLSGQQKLFVTFSGRGGDPIVPAAGGTEQLRQVDLESGVVVDFGPRDRRGFVLGEHDRVLGTNAATGRAPLSAVVRLFDQDRVRGVQAVDAEETKIDALHAIRAAVEIDDRVPTSPGRFLQTFHRQIGFARPVADPRSDAVDDRFGRRFGFQIDAADFPAGIDAVTAQDPAGGPFKNPGDDDHVAAKRRQPLGDLTAVGQIVQVRHRQNRHTPDRTAPVGDGLFQRPLFGVARLAAADHNGQRRGGAGEGHPSIVSPGPLIIIRRTIIADGGFRGPETPAMRPVAPNPRSAGRVERSRPQHRFDLDSPRPKRPPARRGRSRRSLAIAAAALSASAVGAAVSWDYWSAYPADASPRFVGSDACVNCHVDQAADHAGSHHNRAMDVADDSTVLGDFDDVTLTHHGVTSRMFRDGDRYMVHTEGPDGRLADFEVEYVFGVHPIQQYMVAFDRESDQTIDPRVRTVGSDGHAVLDGSLPRLQVLRITWDAVAERWFHLDPPDVDDRIAPDDPLHWTGSAQRWQTMCADCHSTNLRRGFDVADRQYHTTMTDLDVGCESCHGPGSLHVAMAGGSSLFWDRNVGYGLTDLKGDAETQVQSCAPCHSRRSLIAAGHTSASRLDESFALEPFTAATYHADGQIKDEDYVHGSFLQSKMYHRGIRCTDCHDPHTLRLKHDGNATCTSCHQHNAGIYDTPAHHRHAVGTAGASCVECHMPATTYMAVDRRRDHSLRVPRPDLSVSIGTPNACTGCHIEDVRDRLPDGVSDTLPLYQDWLASAEAGDEPVAALLDEVDAWCDAACDRWYGDDRRQPAHFGETVAAFRRGERGAASRMLRMATAKDDVAPAVARASLLNEFAGAADPTDLPRGIRAARKLIADDSQRPVVRAAAARLIGADGPKDAAAYLFPLLRDASRLVRHAAAETLATPTTYRSLSAIQRGDVDRVLDDVLAGLTEASDTVGAHMRWAMLCESRGRDAEAAEAYRRAIRVDPTVAGPRTNLAALIERVGGDGAEADRLRREELPLLGRDADLAPDLAAVQYRYGLALYLAGEIEPAQRRLDRAAEIEPDVPTYRHAAEALRRQTTEALRQKTTEASSGRSR